MKTKTKTTRKAVAPEMVNLACYVDPRQPGIIRFFNGADSCDGLLAGSRAKVVAQCLNEHAALTAVAEAAHNYYWGARDGKNLSEIWKTLNALAAVREGKAG